MEVEVVLLPKYIGESQFSITLSTKAKELTKVLDEVRASMKSIRKMEPGDVVIIPQRCFMIDKSGFREISVPFCAAWRLKTPVERLLACIERERMNAKLNKMSVQPT